MRMAARTAMTVLLAFCVTANARAGAPVKPPGAPVDLPLDDDVVPASLDVIPTNDDMEREYPRLALTMDLGGKAIVTCTTTVEGRLQDCHVDSEGPAGLGFGAATVRASAYFRVKPAVRDGKPIEAKITIPVNWQTDPNANPTPKPQPTLPPVSPTSLALARRALALQDVSARSRANWQLWLDQQAAQLVEVDDAQSGQRALDALRQGLTETIDAETERSAHLLAAKTTEADLRATVSFMESPAGKAWTAAEAQLYEAQRSDEIDKRIALAARAHLCSSPTCADIAAPSTKRAAR